MNTLRYRQQLIITFLTHTPGQATRQIQEWLAARHDSISRASVIRDLTALTKAGYIYSRGHGRAVRYYIDDRRGLRWVAGSETPDAVYITRVFNFGTWKEWKEMIERYPRQKIEAALRQPLRGSWTRRGKALAEAVFGIPLPESVILTYD